MDIGSRAAHSCDKVHNCLYIFGGWNGKNALNDLYILDLDRLIWYKKILKSNLFFRSEPETFGPIPACRNNHTTAVYGDKIYFHGGHDGNQWLDDLYVLNTSSLVWSKPKVSG